MATTFRQTEKILVGKTVHNEWPFWRCNVYQSESQHAERNVEKGLNYNAILNDVDLTFVHLRFEYQVERV